MKAEELLEGPPLERRVSTEWDCFGREDHSCITIVEPRKPTRGK